MNAPVKQHLIDPEICIRCYTCEEACPVDAITHNDDNVVVDFDKCEFCMNCIAPCPTGSIDNWRVVTTPYTLEEQFEWMELPEQEDIETDGASGSTSNEAMDDAVAALLAEAHQGAGGKSKAPVSASKPSINLFNLARPAEAVVAGNFRLTHEGADADIRHIILDFGNTVFPVLEGQSIGIIAPGEDEKGQPHLPRLYSISSPRDGEKPNTNNLSLTVKREELGVCSNYVCDLKKGDTVRITGPFGATFLMPNDSDANVLMICTGTGSAPFRGFTMRRQRTAPEAKGQLQLFFGARRPVDLPYFGPIRKVPENILKTEFAFSRVEGEEKQYVQDKLLMQADSIGPMLQKDNTYIYVCGLKAMEGGVNDALNEIAAKMNLEWDVIRDTMRESGRYHVETY